MRSIITRSANASKININSSKFRDKLKEKYPELEGIDIEGLYKEFFEFFTDYIAVSRNGVNWPYYIGYMFSGCYPIKGNDLSFKRAEGAKKTFYSINGMDGFMPRVYYSTGKTTRHFIYCRFWGFIPSVEMMNKTRTQFKSDHKAFVIIDNTECASGQFNRFLRKEVMIKKEQKLIEEGYDEFKFDDEPTITEDIWQQPK